MLQHATVWASRKSGGLYKRVSKHCCRTCVACRKYAARHTSLYTLNTQQHLVTKKDNIEDLLSCLQSVKAVPALGSYKVVLCPLLRPSGPACILSHAVHRRSVTTRVVSWSVAFTFVGPVSNGRLCFDCLQFQTAEAYVSFL